MNELSVTYEIASAFLGKKLNGENASQLKADPKGFLASEFAMNFDEGIDISVVENTSTRQNLSLPYYSEVSTRPEPLTEDDMADPSGGYLISAARDGDVWKFQQVWGFHEIGIEPGSEAHIADRQNNPDRYDHEGCLAYNNK